MFDPFTLNQLITEHGRTLTLKRLTGDTFDPITGLVTKTSTSYVVRGHFYNDVPEITENSPVAYGSKRAVLSNMLLDGSPTPQPSLQDQISYSGGDDTTVTKVSPIFSGDSVVCYLLHLGE